MNFLFLSRVPAFAFKFDLSSSVHKSIVFTDENYVHDYREKGIKNVIGFKDYLINDNVVNNAIEQVKKYNIQHVIPVEESDVQRAALIRELAGLSGQSYFSSLLYRDKYYMALKLKGTVKVPNFRSVSSIIDVQEFIDKNGCPIVVKPRDLWASTFTYKITSPKQIKQIDFKAREYIAQKWINNATLCTVDGLQKNGEIAWFCIHQYSDNLLDVIEEKKNGFSMMTSPIMLNTKLKEKIRDYTNRVLHVLNHSSTFISPFHLEVFLTEDNELILCEVGCRFGGGATIDLIKIAYHIDLPRLYLELLLDSNESLELLNQSPITYAVCYKQFYPSDFKLKNGGGIQIHKEYNNSDKDPYRRIFNINDFEKMIIFESKSFDLCQRVISNY